MLETIFLKVFNMSLTAAVVILAVLIVRVLLRKAPKIFSYVLWLAVLFRLICPVSFSSAFSLLGALQIEISEKGAVEYIISNSVYEDKERNETGKKFSENNSTYAVTQAEKPFSVSGLKKIIAWAKWTWLAGVMIMLLYNGVTLIKLVKNVKYTVLLRDHIYVGDGIQTPFVLGVVRPRIYLPAILGEEEQEYIILHEQIHMKRKDHIFKFISFFVLCLHWFNPLVWAAFFCSEKDMEMSCDEAVIRKTGLDIKKEYSTSLLTLAAGKTSICGSPLAFGEGDTKSRVKNILNYKKAGFWLILVAVLVVFAAMIILISNPKGVQNSSMESKTLAEQLLDAKNPYIGDTSADGKLAGVLNIGEDIGSYKNVLQTSVAPYGWTFEFEDQWSDVDQEKEFNNIMWKNSVLLMALTDNLGQVFWTYTNSAGEQVEQSIVLTDINNYLGIDVKKYSGSIEQLEDLQNRIEEEIRGSDGQIFDRFQSFVSQKELD